MTRDFLLVLELYHFFCNIVGGVVSPILSNILLDKLDTFVETVLIPQYTRGEKRKLNQEYVKLHRQMHKLLRNGQKEAALKLRKQLQKLPSIDPHGPDYRRLKYVRYADDFGRCDLRSLVLSGAKRLLA